ncbi:MAG: hypothetical protein ACOX28_02695 [Bacilli bacterium]|jgi:hypothetical protein
MDATGNEKQKVNRKENYNRSVKLIFLLVVFQLLFFVALNLGPLLHILKVIAIILVILSIPVFYKAIKGDFFMEIIVYLAPLLIYLITILATLTYQKPPTGVYGELDLFMNKSTISIVGSVFGILSFFMLGVFVNKHDYFTPKVRSYLPLAIFAGLALLVMISLIGTLANYGAYYRVIYAGKVNYYAGRPYLIGNQAKLLMGFNLETVNPKVLVNAAVILCAASTGFLFLDQSENKTLSIVLSSLSVLGLLVIALLPDWKALLFLLPSFAFALLYRFDQLGKKWLKITLIVIGVIILIFLIIGFVIVFGSEGLIKALQSNKVTRKIFLNGHVSRYYQVIRDSFKFNFKALLGVPTKTPVYPLSITVGMNKIYPTGNIFMDLLREAGWFAVLGLLIFAILGIKVAINYLKNSDDSKFNKAILISFLISLFFRYFFYYPLEQYAFTDKYWVYNYFPLFESPLFLISIFILGYMFTQNSLLKGSKGSKQNKKEQQEGEIEYEKIAH